MRFRGEYGFLTNMYDAPLSVDCGHGPLRFGNSEAAYQAMKDPSQALRFTHMSGVEAKRAANELNRKMTSAQHDDWSRRKVDWMRTVLGAKFRQNPQLAEKLMAVACEIREENQWHDNFWGSCTCEKCGNHGRNMLGELLMELRDTLIAERGGRATKETAKTIKGGSTMHVMYTEKSIFDMPDGDRNREYAVCVTTNGMRKADGKAVMGAGIAKTARDRFPGIDEKLGRYLAMYGNRCFDMGRYPMGMGGAAHVVTFPTKHDWRDKSDLRLIEESCMNLVKIVDARGMTDVLLPAPGCGCGGLDFETQVRPILERYLDDRFTVVVQTREQQENKD